MGIKVALFLVLFSAKRCGAW